MNNFDAFTNNFFLFKETPSSPFKVIPWDFDRCFTPPYNAEIVGDNSIIRKLFRNDSTLNLYKRELRIQIENNFTFYALDPVIDSLSTIIKSAYNLDPFLGNGRYCFESEKTKLKEYIRNRIQFVEDNIDHLSSNYFSNK